MTRPGRSLNVRSRLTLSLLAVFLLVLGVILAMLASFQRSQRAEALQSRKDALHDLMEHQRRLFIGQAYPGAETGEAMALLVRALMERRDLEYATHYDADGQVHVTSDPRAIAGFRRRVGPGARRLAEGEVEGADVFERAVLHLHLGDAPRAVLHDTGRLKWESTDAEELRAFAADLRLGAAEGDRGGAMREESVDGRPALRAERALRLGLPSQSFGTLALSYRLDDLQRDEQRARLLLLGLVSSLFLILVVLLNVWLSRIVIAPLRRVLRAMERAGTGDLSVSLEVTSRDEFGLMAGTFNRMARELRTAREAVERYLATVVENVGTGVLFTNSRGVVTTVNRRAAELLRLPEGSEGRTTSEVLEAGDLPKLRELLDTPGGGRREVTLRFPGRRVTLAAAATPLRGEEGNPLGAVLVLDDLTAVLWSQKLRAWKEAVEKVIHEIKNPLTPIRLSAQQLLTAFEEQSPRLPELLPRAVKNILAAVESLSQLLGEFGQFYRLPRPILRDRDLNALVEEAVSLYAGAFPAAVRVEKDLAPDLPRLQADADQLKRVLGNLLQNALEAMDGRGGAVRVSTRRVPGSSVVEIAVADDGRGIGPEDMENLFEPYFTTKPRGTGLGLLISRQIVEEHGGELTLESAPGRGTTARVFLPVGKPAARG